MHGPSLWAICTGSVYRPVCFDITKVVPQIDYKLNPVSCVHYSNWYSHKFQNFSIWKSYQHKQ